MKRQRPASLLIAVVSLAALLIAWPLSRPSATRSLKIRRTILLDFKAEASPAEVQNILKRVKENIIKHKGAHNVFVGAQINERTPFRYGISMDFDDEDALTAYRQGEEHRRMRNDYSHMVEEAQITDIRDE
jgi:hypothetical protein